MKKANIAEAKNNLSKLLMEVRKGETVVILDRDVPIARIEPIGDLGSATSRLPALVREGIAAPPKIRLDAEAFLRRPKPKAKSGASAVSALLAERDEQA